MPDLQTGRGDPPAERPASDAAGGDLLKVFISYRRDDTEEAAVRLYERLAPRLGEENVYLDSEVQPRWDGLPGADQGRRSEGSAFLALIGRRWLYGPRTASAAASGPCDRLRRARAGTRIEQIGLLADSPRRRRCELPCPARAAKLPKTIRRLASINASVVRALSFDSDVDTLISDISSTARNRSGRCRSCPPPGPRRSVSWTPPDRAHCRTALTTPTTRGC